MMNFFWKRILLYSERYTDFFCQKKKNVLWKFDDTILAKSMNFVWLVFSHRFSLWSCMISIFSLWRQAQESKDSHIRRISLMFLFNYGKLLSAFTCHCYLMPWFWWGSAIRFESKWQSNDPHFSFQRCKKSADVWLVKRYFAEWLPSLNLYHMPSNHMNIFSCYTTKKRSDWGRLKKVNRKTLFSEFFYIFYSFFLNYFVTYMLKKINSRLKNFCKLHGSRS